jgi:hypothetical protein
MSQNGATWSNCSPGRTNFNSYVPSSAVVVVGSYQNGPRRQLRLVVFRPRRLSPVPAQFHLHPEQVPDQVGVDRGREPVEIIHDPGTAASPPVALESVGDLADPHQILGGQVAHDESSGPVD